MRILSLFFSADRNYIAVVDETPKGLRLIHVNSTEHGIDLFTAKDDILESAINEYHKLLKLIPEKIEQLVITLPAEHVLVSKFPGNENISMNDLKKLVELEIKQNFPQFNYHDFTSTVIPLLPGMDKKLMLMGIIIPKDIYATCKILLEPLDLPIKNVEISQLNTHSAFIYNYPEHSDKAVAFFGIKKRFIDISVIKEKKPLYYNLVSYKDNESICDICHSEFTRIVSEYIDKIDLVYFFGYSLTKEILDKAKEVLSSSVDYIGRLNAFRMMTASLSDREKDYCSRAAHIYPPCIGACIPPFHNRIKLI
ncbi:MAG: hypothetical protein EPN82_02720 [Bacteroidetes bacterium]|nr:MAG: hypothetical protein EPN82_02720 [Bacteroidota bacterium]